MNAVRLFFTITDYAGYAASAKDGVETLAVLFADSRLTVRIRYDFHAVPMTLTAAACPGDRVELILLPHRIEVRLNGTVMDEQWPAGRCLYSLGDPIVSDWAVDAAPYTAPETAEPAILGEFQNAEGWCPGGGVFVGDCMPYVKDGVYHILYLKDRHHHTAKWNLGAHQWAHISTEDFETFRMHPLAVEITDPSEGSICTGSHIVKGAREYLFYTVRQNRPGMAAPIRRSVSEDGYHFTKDPDFGFTLPDRYHTGSARDPKVILGADGRYHMFLTTSLVPENRGCLAHFVSDDLDRWEDVGAPIYVSENAHQPECPDYIEFGGRYYLIFSLCSRAHYLISESPFDGWRTPADPIIPCASVPKGAVWGDKIVFTGFRRFSDSRYAGTMTFRTARAGGDGELLFD